MTTNIAILDALQDQILVLELTELTKNAGIVWSQISPTTYKATNIQTSDCTDPNIPDQTWDAVISRTIIGQSNYLVLDVFRNETIRASINSSVVTEIEDLFIVAERTVIDFKRSTKEAIRFYQQAPNAHSLSLGPPFSLSPMSDLTGGQLTLNNNNGNGWNPVPATGMAYDKIRKSVDAHAGDSSYIYTSNQAVAEFGFDQLPNYAPEAYGKVKIRISAKNIYGPKILKIAILLDDITQNFSTNITDKYEVYEWNWDDRMFTKEEVNKMRLQLVASDSINYINAVELQADDPV